MPTSVLVPVDGVVGRSSNTFSDCGTRQHRGRVSQVLVTLKIPMKAPDLAVEAHPTPIRDNAHAVSGCRARELPHVAVGSRGQGIDSPPRAIKGGDIARTSANSAKSRRCAGNSVRVDEFTGQGMTNLPGGAIPLPRATAVVTDGHAKRGGWARHRSDRLCVAQQYGFDFRTLDDNNVAKISSRHTECWVCTGHGAWGF